MKRHHLPSLMVVAAIGAAALPTQLQTAAAQQDPINTIPAGGQPAAEAAEAAAIASAQVTRNRVISIMPSQKRALVLKHEERNPFARRNPDVDLITENPEQETEADTIRDILNNLPITGRSYGPKGLRVLAGEIIFERGELVDEVIENQTENLIVEKITEKHIELAWIDLETGKLTGKRLILPYDLSPRVRYVLKGNPLGAGDGQPTTPKFGIMRPHDRDNPTADQIANDRRPNDISPEAFAEGQ